MGFFRKHKQDGLAPEHQKLIDDAMAAAGVDPAMLAGLPSSSAEIAQAQAQAQRYARLQQAGVDTPGTVVDVRPAGQEHELRLSVEGGATYEVTVRQALHPTFPLHPGMKVVLRVDPSDPQNVAVWGGAPDPAAAAGPDPLDALAALADRRDQGLIGEAEYEAERARLLSEM